jgi:NDP-sugar pyrophosphorylase family protein
MPDPTDLQAMLLAAGLGTRLWPLTADRAKPAVPFLGTPLIAGLCRWLARYGVERPVVNTHHRPESIREALSGLEVQFSHEGEILGTAGGIAEALARGLLDPDRTTLVVNAKLYTELDLSAALEAHRRSRAKVTMVLRRNLEREAFREVVAVAGRVTGFGTGRTPSPSSQDPLLFTGIHLLEPEVLRALPRRPHDTVADVYPELIARGEVGAYFDESRRWWEFSTLERYLALHVRAASEGLAPEVVLGPGARIAAGARARRAVLWEGAQVPSDAELTDVVLGAGVVLPRGARISSCAVIRADRATEPPLPGTRTRVEGDLVIVPLSPS